MLSSKKFNYFFCVNFIRPSHPPILLANLSFLTTICSDKFGDKWFKCFIFIDVYGGGGKFIREDKLWSENLEINWL